MLIAIVILAIVAGLAIYVAYRCAGIIKQLRGDLEHTEARCKALWEARHEADKMRAAVRIDNPGTNFGNSVGGLSKLSKRRKDADTFIPGVP